MKFVTGRGCGISWSRKPVVVVCIRTRLSFCASHNALGLISKLDGGLTEEVRAIYVSDGENCIRTIGTALNDASEP